MKNTFKYILIALSISAIITLHGCSDPTKDKDGNEIPLIKADFPKFDARYLVELYSRNGNITNPVTNNVNLKITGKSASKLVNENGRIYANQSNNSISGGVLSLNLDPNIKISASNPVDFNISGENANYLVIDQHVSQTAPGDKILGVEVIEIGNLRAAMPKTRAAETDIVTVSGSGFSKYKSLQGIHNGNGYNYISLYKASASGATITLTGPTSGYDDWGVYVMGVDNISLPPHNSKTINIPAGRYFATVAKAANLINGKIAITLNGSIKASTSFSYEITAGSQVYTGVLPGVLPMTSTIEQIFVPNNTQATIKIIPSYPYKVTAPSKSLTITNNSNISFDVEMPTTTAGNIKRCDITLTGYCDTDKKIGYSVTRTFQYRLADTDEPWQWGEIVSGKCTMFLKDKARYTFRIAVNNTMISYDISTNRKDINDIISSIPDVTKYIMTDVPGGYTIELQVESSELCGITG